MGLYTIGYGGMGSADDLIDLVEELNATIYDVRLKTRAYLGCFNGASLKSKLGDDGYRHAEGLGNLNYKSGTEVNLQDPEPWLKEIQMRLENDQNIILICSCKDVGVCHRRGIAEELEKRTGNVAVHFRQD